MLGYMSRDFGIKLAACACLIALLTGGSIFAFAYLAKKDAVTLLEIPGGSQDTPLEPELKTEEAATGYNNIWDMVFVNNNTLVFNERGGKLHGLNTDSKEKWEIAKLPNVRIEGEGGLLGLARDNEFATNRYMYACYNATGSKTVVKVTRFKLSDDAKSASDYTDIISDIQSQAGRHSGCRMTMDTDSVLWIGTGDSALASAPQDPTSLAGKVLRVDRNGASVSGNAVEPFDTRIYNYGHRNIQGIVLLQKPLKNGAIGLTSEHGTDKQDEINWLLPGNFGWDPKTTRNTYNESAPMTDKQKYPDALSAVWNSGETTVAVSGITFLTSPRWKLWAGWLAVATLKGEHVRLLQINGNGSVVNDKKILTNFGRLRAIIEAPNGDVFIATDNGKGTDKIVRVIPQ